MSQTTAEYIWLLGVVAWFLIRLPHQVRSAKEPIRVRARGVREAVLLAILTAGLWVIPAVYVLTGLPRLGDYGFLSAVGWIGTAVLVASLWLFYRSHRDLGRHWSFTLDIRENHKLVTTGIYARIRHPMYASFLLLGLAQALLLPNWFAGPAGLVAAAVLTMFRVRHEEALMLREFGDEYRSYVRGTRRVIPWLI